MWGCERPAESPVWEDEGDLYYSCPLLFIPPEVVEWYQEYDYCVNVRGMEYEELPWTWLEAYRAYRNAMTTYEHRRASESAQKANSLTAFRTSKLRGDDDG